MELLHHEQHDRHPKRQTDQIVEVALGELIGEVRLQNPAIHGIQGQAEDEQWIPNVAEGHGSVAAVVKSDDVRSDERRAEKDQNNSACFNNQLGESELWYF